jgi:hypothetical protein
MCTGVLSPRFIFSTTHCSLLRLIVRSGLEVPTFVTSCLHAWYHARTPSGGRWNCGQENVREFCLNTDLHITFRDLFHAEGRRAEDLFDLKIRRLRSGVNPRCWVPKASTLHLEHRSRFPLIKRPELEVDHACFSSVEVKNERKHTSNPSTCCYYIYLCCRPWQNNFCV